jgi:hypothetical protein
LSRNGILEVKETVSLTQPFNDFKRSLNLVSRGIRRVNQYVPCHECQKLVRRSPAQLRQAKHVFCSVTCKTRFYNRERYHQLQVSVNQRAFGVSLVVAKALAYEVDPWQLSKKESVFK